jgi:tetratricopeptide (TPR) repeat protein
MARTYKVKLESGRVLGPVDLERVRLLILKNQILGKELARTYPSGDWVKIVAIPELGELFVAHAEGKLNQKSKIQEATSTSVAATTILDDSPQLVSVQPVALSEFADLSKMSIPGEEPMSGEVGLSSPELDTGDDDKTMVGNHLESSRNGRDGDHDDKTMVASHEQSVSLGLNLKVEEEPNPKALEMVNEAGAVGESFDSRLAREETIMIQPPEKPKKGIPTKEKIKAVIAAIALGVAGYQVLFGDADQKAPVVRQQILRPVLPNFQAEKPDANGSQKSYNEGMKDYILDNVAAYRRAAQKFSKATEQDSNNVKALALLASSYINLIDSSNKDENYFAVISKLIDMTRAKNVDLPETVIADVEFFCVVNKPEAAENRVVEYAKTHQSINLEMFYYLALSLYSRGDFQGASRYVGQIADNKVFSAKVFYLEGMIAEKLGDSDTALLDYEKALKTTPLHAKSRLRIADIQNQRGRIQEAKKHLTFLVAHPELQTPKELGLSYYLHSILSEQEKKYEIALGDAERAVQLDKDDHSYLLQLYSMRAKGGEAIADVRRDAKMYYHLGEGERLLKDGKVQEALTEFLTARQMNNDSPIPLVKIGDMFSYLHDTGNARVNYKLASDRAPNNIDIWSKYIDALIQSFDWDEAQKAMEKFRQLPVSQSAIDKAAGDMYAKQGQHKEAQAYYRKAMARASIDAAVYIAYAKSLMATQNYKEAPFFFALAQRYDPLNVDAIIGTAKCIANTESIDRAISLLEDELQKGNGSRAELLSAIADFQIQKGSWDQAQRTVDEATSANPDYAYPWKLQAQIDISHESTDRHAIEKALQAYQSYSDRNSSDPSGYLERYRIFTKMRQYDKAADELGKIYSIYPKYPNLHLYKGELYALMGNSKVAVEEITQEIQNNPTNANALIALGKQYIEQGKLNESLVQFNKAMQISPDSSEPKHMSGYANYLLKNYAGAVALYQAAIAKDPGNPLIYKRLGLAYRDLGDQANAAASFRKYIQMDPDAPDRAEFARYR